MFNQKLILILSIIVTLSACTTVKYRQEKTGNIQAFQSNNSQKKAENIQTFQSNNSQEKAENIQTFQSNSSQEKTKITKNVEPYNRDTKIVFATVRKGNRDIYIMDSGGVSHKQLTNNEFDYPSPHACSSDGTKILFTTFFPPSTYQSEALYIMNSDGSDKKHLITGDSHIYSPSFSADGERIVFTQDTGIFTMDINGNGLKKIAGPTCSWPEWSPDGTKVIYIRKSDSDKFSPTKDVYIINADGTGESKLTSLEGVEQATWSHNGKKIALYGKNRSMSTSFHIFTINADGSGLKQLTDGSSNNTSPQWSPNDDRIAFTYSDPLSSSSDIYTIKSNGSDLQRLTMGLMDGNYYTPIRFEYPIWSPDGREIAFEGSLLFPSKDQAIFIMNANGSNEKNLTSKNSVSYSPIWCGK